MSVAAAMDRGWDRDDHDGRAQPRARRAGRATDRRTAGLADRSPRADCPADRSVERSQAVEPRNALRLLGTGGSDIVSPSQPATRSGLERVRTTFQRPTGVARPFARRRVYAPAVPPDAEAPIDIPLVLALLKEQHPDLAGLSLVEAGEGWDNQTFRLGNDLAVRLPRRAASAPLIEHEQRWLPSLALPLPLPVPSPVRIGRPGCGFPWRWSVTRW